MVVSLGKGGELSLTEEAGTTGLSTIAVGLGWDVRTTTGADFDLDASAICCDADGRVVSDEHFVFFNNLTSPDGSVRHTGDNVTGAGDGDDERITIDLASIEEAVSTVVFPVTIYEAGPRRQSFGQVSGAFIRVVNVADDAELARYDLAEDDSTETAMVFGELVRDGEDWRFRAIGRGYPAGLVGIARDHGVDV